jgi:hypothetical protein
MSRCLICNGLELRDGVDLVCVAGHRRLDPDIKSRVDALIAEERAGAPAAFKAGAGRPYSDKSRLTVHPKPKAVPRPPCTTPGCEAPQKAKGLCHKCYCRVNTRKYYEKKKAEKGLM